MVVFEIRGQPMGKERPKFARMGGFVRAYTPKKTKDYEELVKKEYEEQCGYEFGDKPLSILIKAFFEVPKSYSFKKKYACLSGEIRPTTKPDTDNIAKAILDGLTQSCCFQDDKQVVDLYVEKYYSIEPRVRVIIEEVNEEKEGE